MSGHLDDEKLREIVRKANAHDSDQVKRLADQFSREDGTLVESIQEYRAQLGFGDNDAGYGPDIRLDSPGFFQPGAQAFIQVLGEHPVFYEERGLAVGAPIFGDTDDPFLSELGHDVSQLLVAGALAIGLFGAQDQRYTDALVHVAFSADAISTLLRIVLSGKPIPSIDDLFHIPDRLQDLYKHTCILGIKHALDDFGMALNSHIATSWSTGITRLDPNSGCAGSDVTIYGSGFGQPQPSDVEVWFPTRQGKCTKAQVVPPWTDNKITALAPTDVGAGCVGFVRIPSSPIPMAGPAGTLAGEMEQCLGVVAFAAAERIRSVGNMLLFVQCPPCLANGANYFDGGLPVVEWFTINGSDDLFVEPDTELILGWGIAAPYVSNVHVRRTSSKGPFIDMDVPKHLSRVDLPRPARYIQVPRLTRGNWNIGKFTGTSPEEATYELTATNACGTIKRTARVRLRKTPALKILGVEVIQAIQHFDLANPALNNSVRLVAGKRTMVRIFVDSGITNGFNNGAGPNLQPNVTGDVTVFPVGANQGFDAGPPLSRIDGVNTGGVVTARPAASINRNLGVDSLNFELPLNLVSGTIRLDVRVWVRGHESDVGGPWRAFGSTTVSFQTQPTQEVLPFLITDTLLALPAPTLAQYNVSLQGARSRYPIAESGFIVNPPIGLFTDPDRGHILTSAIGWELLLTDLTTMIFVFPSTPVGGIRTAVVPNDPRYAVNGIGVPRIALTVPAFIARAAAAGANGLDPFAGTFAHEMGHSFGVGHAQACFTPSPFDPVDGRLPGKTEDTGMEVPTRTVIPSGRGEIMSYNGDQSACPGAPRWPSIAFWDIIFDSMPI